VHIAKELEKRRDQKKKKIWNQLEVAIGGSNEDRCGWRRRVVQRVFHPRGMKQTLGSKVHLGPTLVGLFVAMAILQHRFACYAWQNRKCFVLFISTKLLRKKTEHDPPI